MNYKQCECGSEEFIVVFKTTYSTKLICCEGNYISVSWTKLKEEPPLHFMCAECEKEYQWEEA